jgi:hypothetical protein
MVLPDNASSTDRTFMERMNSGGCASPETDEAARLKKKAVECTIANVIFRNARRELAEIVDQSLRGSGAAASAHASVSPPEEDDYKESSDQSTVIQNLERKIHDLERQLEMSQSACKKLAAENEWLNEMYDHTMSFVRSTHALSKRDVNYESVTNASV